MDINEIHITKLNLGIWISWIWISVFSNGALTLRYLPVTLKHRFSMSTRWFSTRVDKNIYRIIWLHIYFIHTYIILNIYLKFSQLKFQLIFFPLILFFTLKPKGSKYYALESEINTSFTFRPPGRVIWYYVWPREKNGTHHSQK